MKHGQKGISSTLLAVFFFGYFLEVKMENRTKILHFKLSIREREALELMKKYEGRNLSEMLRELVREGAQRRGLWPHTIPNLQTPSIELKNVP